MNGKASEDNYRTKLRRNKLFLEWEGMVKLKGEISG